MYSISKHYHQHGAVLVVSLLILLIMSIIGISSMQNTLLEERMAGNLKDKNVALEAAEAALRDGEAYIEKIVTTGGFDGTDGLYGLYDDEEIDDWTASKAKTYPEEYSSDLDYVYSQPQFKIKLAGIIPVDINVALNIDGYVSSGISADDITAFEVTARGVGKSPNSTVLLRSVYGRKM